MAILTIVSAQRSKDPATQVGACIVGEDNRILSMGYNGMPAGCDDDEMPWNREGDALESKYFYVCDAELIVEPAILRVLVVMPHYFLVMNAQRRLFRPA